MKLYLMQHCKPLTKEEDPERPLSSEGDDDAQRIGRFLKKNKICIEKILHSGKTRSRQTAEIALSTSGIKAEIVEQIGISPLDEVKDIALSIQESQGDLMLVGHLPHLAKLVSLLVTGDESFPHMVSFQQGGIVCLSRNGEKKWCISWMVTPDLVCSS